MGDGTDTEDQPAYRVWSPARQFSELVDKMEDIGIERLRFEPINNETKPGLQPLSGRFRIPTPGCHPIRQ